MVRLAKSSEILNTLQPDPRPHTKSPAGTAVLRHVFFLPKPNGSSVFRIWKFYDFSSF